ncbi:MAG: radical SAM protein [Nanoarchaeota archaeon]
MKRILIMELFLNTYKSAVFFKSKEPDVSTLRAISVFKTKYKIRFIDFKIDNPSEREIIKEINKSDFLFINIKSYNRAISLKIIHKSIQYNSEIKIFAYGQLPENMPQLFSEISKRVYPVRGELYEYALKFINEIDKGESNFSKLKTGTCFRKLDQIPKIDLEEMKKRDYFTIYPMGAIKKNKWAFMNLSEGCPYQCIFCSQTLRISHGRKVRHFSIKGAIRRIKRIKGAGFNAIRFVDDDFLGDVEFIDKLCKQIIIENMDIKWMAQVRADRINENVLELMSKAGCECLNFGVESGSERILNILKKGHNVKQIIKATQLCRKYGIKIAAYFMIGSPTETLKDIRKSIELSFELKPDVLQVCYFIPYEGSPFYENNKNLIIKKKMDRRFHYSSCQDNYSKVNKLKKIYLIWNFKYYLFNLDKSIILVLSNLLFYPKRAIRIMNEAMRMVIYGTKKKESKRL